jgi:hypothetical protein
LPGDPTTALDLSSPRTVGQILDAAFRTYGRRPLLFISLAAIMLVPYGVVSVVIYNTKHVPATTEFVLLLADVALVNPFVSALQMQALMDLGSGLRPAPRDLIRRGITVLPVVAAADIIAGIAEFAGLLVFIVPGIIVALRLAVVAPAAACERITWPEALSRSFALTRGNAWRVLGLLAIQGLLSSLALGIESAGSIGVAIAGAALWVIAQSFCTLLINLLYFDLRARQVAPVAWQ